MIQTKYQWLDWIPAVVMTAGIAIVSLWEYPQVPRTLSANDKIMHGLMYALLAVTWMIPVRKRTIARVSPYVYVWLSVTVYGALIETLQRFCTLSRSGEMADLYADALGALVGIAIAIALSVKKDSNQ
jgi:VanZ family protein